MGEGRLINSSEFACDGAGSQPVEYAETSRLNGGEATRFSCIDYHQVASGGFASFGGWEGTPQGRPTVRTSSGPLTGILLIVIGNNRGVGLLYSPHPLAEVQNTSSRTTNNPTTVTQGLEPCGGVHPWD